MDDKDNPQNSPAPDLLTNQPDKDLQSPVASQPDQKAPSPFSTNVDETTDSPVPAVAPKKRKKGFLIALIVAAIVLFGLGLAYVYGYQKPDKVVSDALVHALSAKSLTYTGTVTTAGSSKMVATLNGGATVDGGTVNAKFAFDVEGKKYTLDGNGIIDKKNDIYLKVQNIDGLVNNYRRAIPADSQPLFDQIIDKINDKWVKISAEDLKSYSPDLVKTQECFGDALSEMQSDNAVRAELINTYKKHPFIKINKTLGAKDGSLGYLLTSNNELEKAFGKEFKNTSFYKTLVKCDSSFTVKDKDLLNQWKGDFSGSVTTELWVNRWSHQITKVAFKQDEHGQTTNVAFEPKFNRPVAIVTPKDATTLEQLQKDIQALLQSTPSAPATAPTSE